MKFLLALIASLFRRRRTSSPALLPVPDPKFLGRLYTGGFRIDDLQRVNMRGVLLVRPLQPPERVGGLFVPATAAAMPGTMTMVHQVVACGPGCKRFRRGDVVVCRLSHLDPLDAQTGILAIDEKHVYAPVDDSLALAVAADEKRRAEA